MDRRRDRRWQTMVFATCLLKARQFTVAITEISANGCRLQGDLGFAIIGDQLTLNVGSIGPLDATVRWATVDAAGVEFRERLEQGVVAYFTAFCRPAA